MVKTVAVGSGAISNDAEMKATACNAESQFRWMVGGVRCAERSCGRVRETDTGRNMGYPSMQRRSNRDGLVPQIWAPLFDYVDNQ